MGTVVRFFRQRAPSRPVSKPSRPRRSYFPALLLVIGLAIIAATIGSTALAPWFENVSPRSMNAGVHVVDGDSLRTGNEKIRLIGIDAPERGQTCSDARGREWSCGLAAKTRLSELVAQGPVACTPHGHDRYGRTLAVCSAGNIADVGRVLVREGYAVNYAFKANGYSAEEHEARKARRGVWQGAFEAPQNWRRRHARSG